MVAVLGAAVVCVFSPALPAAPALQSATVTEIGGNKEVYLRKEAQAEEAAAKQNDVIAGKDMLRTGRKSRAELEFADKSLARLGSNTIFSFDPAERRMKLDRGTALIHVPPGVSGEKTTIAAPAATVGILGDVVAMRVNPDGVTQVVALSRDSRGPVTVTFEKTQETRTLEPGQLLTISPADVKMPEPITVAVDVFVQSSGLANGFEKELPKSADSEIRQTREQQREEIRSGGLEGPEKVAMKMEGAPQVSTADVSAITDAISGSRFAGRYRVVETAPGDPSYSYTLELQPDGRFTGGGVSSDGFAFSFTGQTGSVDASGNFTFQTDGSTGQGTFTGNGFTGTRVEGNEGGTQDGETAAIVGTRQ